MRQLQGGGWGVWGVLLPADVRVATECSDGVERNASGVHGSFRVVGGVCGVCCCRRTFVERQSVATERSAMRVACTVASGWWVGSVASFAAGGRSWSDRV